MLLRKVIKQPVNNKVPPSTQIQELEETKSEILVQEETPTPKQKRKKTKKSNSNQE